MTAPPTPLLSIVVPVYRVEAYLPACLESILAEADANVEIITVNDCSPDGSGAIADRYAERDPRVRVRHLPANVGLGRARNIGLEEARGEYVWFVDSDDWLPAGALPAVVARLAHTRPDVLVIDQVDVFPDGRTGTHPSAGALRGIGGPLRLSQRPRLLTVLTSACTKVVRRSFLDEIGLRFSPGWYEDVPFAHTALLAAQRIDALERVCYYYRQRDGEAITKSVSPRHFEVFDQYDRLWAFVDKAAPEYDEFRPELFRLMINHLLVIAGNEHRLPPELRREFFARLVRVYRRRLPGNGYAMPTGATGLKHWLVRRDAYRAYAALRLAWRARPGRAGGPAGRRRHAPPQTRNAQEPISYLG